MTTPATLVAPFSPLRGRIRAYDWGSLDAIPALRGVAPDGRPQAELWLGDHPAAPADVLVGGDWRPLPDVCDDDPAGHLGPGAAPGGRLPFLFKVLAARRPLSIQVHPDAALASSRPADFGDANGKPEAMYALSRFDLLAGFRPPERSAEALRTLRVPALAPLADALATGDRDAIPGVLRAFFAWPEAERRRVVAEVAAAATAACPGGPALHPLDACTVRLLVDQFGPDDGVVVALLLDRITLHPGESLYVAPGTVHAYLGGTGLEVMASSDNVVRGGLTTKHVDPGLFLATLDPGLAPTHLAPTPAPGPAAVEGGRPPVAWYEPPCDDFSFAVVDVSGAVELDVAGPHVVLCHAGTVALRRGTACVTLASGDAAWVTPSARPYGATGTGRLAVAATAGARRT